MTELVLYRPISSDLRKEICDTAEKTALYTKDAKTKTPFSYLDIFLSPLRNSKHRVCARSPHFQHPSSDLIEKTARLVADAILGNEILSKKGSPKPLFCSPYVASILQSSLFLQALKSLDPSDVEAFKFSTNGFPNRIALIEKIAGAFKASAPKGPVEQLLHKTYWDSTRIGKLVRRDVQSIMSSYLAKNLDKLSERSAVAT